MSIRVLVVDNDFFFVEFMSELLEKRGFEVVKAYDGKEGIAAAEERLPDIVFVDLIMPKIDGKLFIEYLNKKHPERPFTIVAVSGTILEQGEELEKIGADFFVAKGPLEKMSEQIESVLDKILKSPEKERLSAEDEFDRGHLFPRMDTIELIENEAFIRSIMDSLGAGILATDTDARIFIANTTALEIMRRPMEKTLNMPLLSLFKQDSRDAIREMLKEIAKTKKQIRLVKEVFLDSKKIRVIATPLTYKDRFAGFTLTLVEAPNG